MLRVGMPECYGACGGCFGAVRVVGLVRVAEMGGCYGACG